jgi:sugar O-acyltransferase (sialic acid O-acetyltransferase NeuD family)
VTTLHLCGAGNSEGVRLALTVNRRFERWRRVVLLDDDVRRHGGSLLGVPIIGGLDELARAERGSAAVNLVARTTAGRAAVRARIAATGVPLATLVHPSVDAGDCALGQGVLVYEQAILSPETSLGDGTVVFMRAVVGHEAHVGAGCVLAAGSVLNARAVLGERVYVGSNASVLPEVRIGDGATVGANTMVAADVPASATVLGVPGQVLANASSTLPSAGADRAYEDVQAQLLGLLHAVLGHTDASATDRFFDVGGTSLRAIRFLASVRAATGRDVPLPVFYARCTVRELALFLCGAPPGAGAAGLGRDRALFRRRMIGGTAPA